MAKLFGEGHAKKKAVSTSEGPKRIDKILDLDLGAESAQPAAEAPVPESVGKVVMSETERAQEVVPTPAEKKSELLRSSLPAQRAPEAFYGKQEFSEEDYYVRDDEIMQEAAKLQEKGSISEAELEQFSKEALTALKSPVETAPAEVKQAVAETEIGEKPSAELYAVELPPAKTLEEQADEAARRLLSEIDTGLSYQPRRAEEILRAYGFRDTELQGKSPNELYAIIREKLASRSEARPETEAGEVPLAQEGAPGVVKKEQKQVVVEDKEAERAKQIAREILSATDKGGVPAFISKKLEHVLLTLGVATEDEVKKGRPEDLIARLKVAMSEGGQPAGQKTEAKPAEGIVAEKEPVLTEGGVRAKEKAGDKEKAKKEKVPETPEEREERKKYEALEKNLGEERAKYAELSRKIKKLEGSKKPEERAEAEKLKTGLEAAQKEYLEARKQEFEYKLSFFEKEADGKIKAGEFAAEEKEAEIKKFTTFGLVGEFKQLYDTKTALEIEENKKLHKYREKIYDFVNWYGKVDWKKKVVISVAVGSLSGGAGIAALRVMSGASLAVALEKGMRKGHEQKIAKELEHLIGSKIGEAMEKIEKGKVAEGLAQFLKSEDAAMLKEFESSEASLREKERRLKQRRWLFAGAAGLVVGSGASALAIRNVADMTGIHPVDYLSGKLELKQRLGATYDFLRSAWEKEHSGVKRAGAAVHKGAAAKLAVEAAAVKHEIPTGAKLASHLEAVAKESHNVATIEKGGNIWKAAHSFVGRALNEEQFRHAWAHSTVEINGIKVPINEVGLSHAHDQIIFTPDAQGGHFEVVNYAKNLRFGTNEDLYKAFVKGHKPVPDWLLKATGHKQLIVGKLAEHGAAVGAHPTAEVPVTHPTGAEAAHASGVGTISPDEMAARIAHAPNMKAGIDQYFEYARKFTDWHDHLNSLEKFQAAHTLDSASQKYFEDKNIQEIADKFTHGSFSEQQQMYEGMLRFLVRSSDPSLKDWCSHLIGNFAKDPVVRRSCVYV